MLRKEVHMVRPRRWDVPYDEQMSSVDVDRLLAQAPFSEMDPDRFPPHCSLRGLLQNDTRIVQYREGDLVVREADYGHSAFLILSGSVRVTLDSLPPVMLGRPSQRGSFLKKLWKLCFRSAFPEVRSLRPASRGADSSSTGQRQDGQQVRIFLQDIPGVLDAYRTAQLTTGEVFGEVAALARSPRSATVFAAEPTRLLEIRWQGLRDLMRYAPAWRDHIHQLYRQNSLASHLRETPFLKNLSDATMAQLVAATQFESYGDWEWHRPYQELAQKAPEKRIEAEPVIAKEGNLPNGLLLVRTGFARLSQRYGHGHRTVSYLGKGQCYGLEELYHQWESRQSVPLDYSLRALGYVDILRIPTDLVETLILPQLPPSEERRIRLHCDARAPNGPFVKRTSSDVPPNVPPDALSLPVAHETRSEFNGEAGSGSTKPIVPDPQRVSLLEHLVEHRLINGTQAMVIQLDRCTRCDDCVRACAATHDNNPRFVRAGQTFGNLLFASACMHCADPVCMIGCPTGAIGRDHRTGAVTIHDQTCIGCSTCANSCPYQAIRMVDIRDARGTAVVDQTTQLPIMKATKCDLCQDLWGGPACQRACPHDALVRIDLQRPDELQNWMAR